MTDEDKIKEQIDKMFKDAISQIQNNVKIGCGRCEYCKNGNGKGNSNCLSAKNITQGFKDYFKEQHNITNEQELKILDRVFHCSNLYKLRKLWAM